MRNRVNALRRQRNWFQALYRKQRRKLVMIMNPWHSESYWDEWCLEAANERSEMEQDRFF